MKKLYLIDSLDQIQYNTIQNDFIATHRALKRAVQSNTI